MHSPHGQMTGVGVPQVVESEVRNARFPARRSEAVFNTGGRRFNSSTAYQELQRVAGHCLQPFFVGVKLVS